MEKVNRDILFQIGIELDLPDLLRLCQSNKQINDKLCQQDAIWNYRLEKDFGEYLDFQARYPNFKPIYQKDKREYYILLYGLNKIKTALRFQYNLYQLYYSKMLQNGPNIKIIPKQIGLLQNLQYLYLTNNKIESIPKEIGNLYMLEELSLGNNDIESIPKEIGQLQNLQMLNLYHNKIESIPKEIGQLQKLQRLYLQNNYIKNIPKVIGQLQNLQVLYLHNNYIKNIPKEIGNIKNLKELFLENNPIKDKEKVKRWIKEKIPLINLDI